MQWMLLFVHLIMSFMSSGVKKQREEAYKAIIIVDTLHLGAVLDHQNLILVDSFQEIGCMGGR